MAGNVTAAQGNWLKAIFEVLCTSTKNAPCAVERRIPYLLRPRTYCAEILSCTRLLGMRQ